MGYFTRLPDLDKFIYIIEGPGKEFEAPDARPSTSEKQGPEREAREGIGEGWGDERRAGGCRRRLPMLVRAPLRSKASKVKQGRRWEKARGTR